MRCPLSSLALYPVCPVSVSEPLQWQDPPSPPPSTLRSPSIPHQSVRPELSVWELTDKYGAAMVETWSRQYQYQIIKYKSQNIRTMKTKVAVSGLLAPSWSCSGYLWYFSCSSCSSITTGYPAGQQISPRTSRFVSPRMELAGEASDRSRLGSTGKLLTCRTSSRAVRSWTTRTGRERFARRLSSGSVW